MDTNKYQKRKRKNRFKTALAIFICTLLFIILLLAMILLVMRMIHPEITQYPLEPATEAPAEDTVQQETEIPQTEQVTETEPEPTEDGTQEEPGSIEVSELVSYKTTPIVDADLGYTMARCYAPADYTVSNAVNVLNVGITTPVQIALSAVSPDGSVTLVYQSAQSFEDDEMTVGGQNFREEDGSQNLSMLTINLYKRDASGFCDLLVGSLLAEGVQAEVAAIAGPDEELKAVIDEKSEKATAEAKELMSGLIGGGMFTTNTDMAVYFDFCEKTYSVMLPDEAG